jgi:hypothetical protein
MTTEFVWYDAAERGVMRASQTRIYRVHRS